MSDFILTIITVNLNNVKGLEKTVKSVINQTSCDFEFIIIDGASTDGSRDVIELYREKITYSISEPDKGIYHAMNKGIAAAKGEYLLFLNSGDWLASNTVLEQSFSQPFTEDIVSGDIYFYDTVKEEVRWHVPSPEKLTAKTLLLGTLPHQATFIKRSLFETYGLYNESLKIASDWLFFLEVLLEHGCSYRHLPVTVSYFAMDGISCSPETAGLPRREQLGVLEKKYPRFLPDYERLQQLENETAAWKSSREYRAYRVLKRIGVISCTVFFVRVMRWTKRKFKS